MLKFLKIQGLIKTLKFKVFLINFLIKKFQVIPIARSKIEYKTDKLIKHVS